MKTLILYESIMGYTEKCAKYLFKKIEGCAIFDISSKDFNLDDYDKILIGAPLYIGEVEKITQKFIKKNKLKLLDKELGLFFSGMSRSEFHIAIQDSLPPNIFYHANIVHCGGVVEFSKLSWKDKRTIKRRLEIKESVYDEMLESLDELI
ncbi:MAG: protoporphyrinogen oxidase [Candidatus Izimaplasma bacterium HR2]|nr:MAG: protoporphyrinogen oxidase [Candidatus Izimaplasma bacterium HR2]